jgi:hypothetical protein
MRLIFILMILEIIKSIAEQFIDENREDIEMILEL